MNIELELEKFLKQDLFRDLPSPSEKRLVCEDEVTDFWDKDNHHLEISVCVFSKLNGIKLSHFIFYRDRDKEYEYSYWESLLDDPIELSEEIIEKVKLFAKN